LIHEGKGRLKRVIEEERSERVLLRCVGRPEWVPVSTSGEGDGGKEERKQR
jgi:hypothetical protein